MAPEKCAETRSCNTVVSKGSVWNLLGMQIFRLFFRNPKMAPRSLWCNNPFMGFSSALRPFGENNDSKVQLHIGKSRWLSGKESTCLAWGMSVRSLGREDSLEKEMATHSSILAWKIQQMEQPGRLQSMGVAKSQTRLSDFTSLHLVVQMKNAIGH